MRDLVSPRYLDYDRRRDFLPGGRIRLTLRTSKKTVAKRRRQRLDDLLDNGGVDVLLAIADGRIHVAEACALVKRAGVEDAIDELRDGLTTIERARVPTFSEAADRYVEARRARRRSKTIARIESELARLAAVELDEVALGEMPVDRIRRRHVERAILANGGKPGTLETYRMTASGLFTWLIENERERARMPGEPPPILTENPAAGLEGWKHEGNVDTASREQVVALLAHAELYQRAYLRLFLHVGLRLTELTHLRFHLDLDPADWMLRVQGRDPDPRCGCLACRNEGWKPKTGRSVREVHIPAEPAALRETLTDFLTLYDREPGDFLFVNPRTGRPWEASSLRRDLERLCEKAGVKYGRDEAGGLTPHVLRHTCATEMIRAGVLESVVAKILGDTVSTIVGLYVHLTPEDLADGISRTPGYRE